MPQLLKMAINDEGNDVREAAVALLNKLRTVPGMFCCLMYL